MEQLSENKLVYMHRGDTFEYPFLILIGDRLNPRKYRLIPGDTVYFAVMEPGAIFEHALIRKAFTNADLDSCDRVKISLTPNDTIHLVPGTYYYEIKLANGDNVTTLVGRRKFIIME